MPFVFEQGPLDYNPSTSVVFTGRGGGVIILATLTLSVDFFNLEAEIFEKKEMLLLI